MQTRPMPASTKAALLVGFLPGLALLFAFSDSISNAKYNARVASCKASFNQIRLAVQSYQAAHGGKLPDAGNSGPPNYAAVGYDYRFLAQPKSADVIYWDSRPHRPCHTVFVWLNRPNRDVLCADGQVNNLPEDEFQQLHLSRQI